MSKVVDARQEKDLSPPYVAWTTFKNFIKFLKEHGVPSRIDKSVMNGLSGGTQSHLASTIRYLGLVKVDLSPTDVMENLVSDFGTDAWQESLSAVLKASYYDVTDGIDLTKATPHQLDKCFENDNQSAAMVDKMVRFYLSGLEEAGIPFSTHLKQRKPKAKRKPGAPKAKESGGQAESNPVTPKSSSLGKVPEGMIEFPIHLKGGRRGSIVMPGDITSDDCEMIELILPMLKKLSNDGGFKN